MNLQTFKFPDDAMTTNKELLLEAQQRGFEHGKTPYNKFFSDLFFSGGRVVFKKGIDDDFKNKAWSYCRKFISSWGPKHEHKEAICAMIMSEILEPTLEK